MRNGAEKTMIVLEPCAGLANRILAIATGYQLAVETGQSMKVLWDIDGAVGVAMEELFTLPEDIKIRKMTKLPYRQKPLLRLKSDIIRMYLRRKAELFWECEDTVSVRRMMNSDYIIEQIEDKHLNYIKAFCELTKITDKSIFAIFQPSEEILQRGENVFQNINKQTVGMHIRRTDHAEAISKSPLELFYQKIEEILQNNGAEKIFLATDDLNVEQKLCGEFEGRVFCYHGKKFGRNSKSGMQDGLIDMLALSKCREIYGSYGSTFSKMASYLGNCELIVLQVEGELY